MKTTTVERPTLESIARDIYEANLSLDELKEVECMIEALKASKEPPVESEPEEPLASNGTTGKTRPPARGCYELKVVYNCGPYLYWKYYVGCKNGRSIYKSRYLGKCNAKPEFLPNA